MKLNIYVLLLIFLVILMYFQPSFLGNLCTNCFGKATLVLLIVFLAIQDISLAILASVVLISSMHLVSREGFKEGNRVRFPGFPPPQRGWPNTPNSPTPTPPQDINCEGTWSDCTTDCETAAERTFTETQAQSGNGDACPAATDCAPGDGACPLAPTCNNFPCQVGQTLKANDITCNTGTCDATTCCEPVDPTNPSPACDSYQDHITDHNDNIDNHNDDTNAHSNSTQSQFTNMRSGFRNRKGGKEGFMVSSSELISFEDSKIRGKDSNIYPVSRPSVQNKGLFSGFNLF